MPMCPNLKSASNVCPARATAVGMTVRDSGVGIREQGNAGLLPRNSTQQDDP